jgi:hypothetical protein
MASFGIDAVRHFGNARAAKVDSAGDLTYTFNRANGLDRILRESGHTRGFYFGDTDCWETDIRDSSGGGDDRTYADSVDLFWIETHGNRTTQGNALMLFDTPQANWITTSNTWQLGEDFNAEWMMAFSCKTVDRNKVSGLWNIFSRLHIYCGAWDNMYDGWTTEECGEDVADNLTDGDTVSAAWHDGVSDWYVDNHPITVCVGDAATWNNGNIQWHRSTLNRDHFWRHGSVEPDLFPNQQACILWRWTEG